MGSFGFGEILIILVVAFLILGPARFQKFIKKIGEAMGVYKKIRTEVEESVRNPVNTFDKIITATSEDDADEGRKEPSANIFEDAARIDNVNIKNDNNEEELTEYGK